MPNKQEKCKTCAYYSEVPVMWASSEPYPCSVCCHKQILDYEDKYVKKIIFQSENIKIGRIDDQFEEENKTDGWRKRFDALGFNNLGNPPVSKKIERFISQLLAVQEKEHQEKLERIKKEIERLMDIVFVDWHDCYDKTEKNEILTKVLEIINKELK
jgi:hypothetical protein